MPSTNYSFGFKALYEAVKNKTAYEINVYKPSSATLKLLNENRVKFINHTDPSFFNAFDRNLNHQNIVFKVQTSAKINFEEFLKQKATEKKSLVLLIDSIEDPQNFGAILRTCDAFGVDAVIYKKDNQVQINDFVSKTSMGAVNSLNLFKVTNLSRSIKELKKVGFWVYASALDDKAKINHQISYDSKTVIVIGNENYGISKLIKDESDFIIKIPMYGSVQSLNVSVATGILLAEVKKQLEK